MLKGAAYEAGDIYTAMENINGIVLREPASYRPLFEFCASLPDDQYLRNGKSRWLARRLLKGKVPDMVLENQHQKS